MTTLATAGLGPAVAMAVRPPGRTDAEAVLRDAGSFTSSWQYAGTDANGNRSEVGSTYYVDLKTGRTHIVTMTSNAGQATAWLATSRGRTRPRPATERR